MIDRSDEDDATDEEIWMKLEIVDGGCLDFEYIYRSLGVSQGEGTCLSVSWKLSNSLKLAFTYRI